MSKKKDSQDSIEKESKYIIPFELWDRDTACALFEFYLYNMARKKDSPLSYNLEEELTDTQKQELLIHLLKLADSNEENFICACFLRNKIKDIRNLMLSDETLTCDKVKGFLQSETETITFDTLMKRIRNSFAHGRISRSQDQAFLILEDKRNQLTGRIILRNQTLMEWRDAIVSYRRENLEQCPA